MKRDNISSIGEKPKTKVAWWAMVLGLCTVLVMPILSIFAAAIRPLIDKSSGESSGRIIGFGIGVFGLILVVSAIITSICALLKGERSWMVWVGFIPAVLVGLFLLLMVIGQLVFPQ